MMQNEMTTANTVAQHYTVFNPIFEGFSNERLYEALCAATAPLNEGLEELQLRLRPIIIGASKAYLTAFSWTLDDAMTEALIHIWDLVRKHSYKAGKVPFHSFFRATWMNFLNGLFQKTVLKNPIMSGNVQIGWCDHEPVFVCGYAFHEKAAEYRNQLYGLKGINTKIVFSDKEFLDISSDQALKQLQELLGLEKPPRRIEGYDISHQSGENTVGSMVVFINGASARSEYRKFKVRTSRNDDLKSLVEVISRRLKHTEWEYPDLIILDGGATQVNAVLPLTQPLGIPVIGRDKSGDHSKSSGIKIIFSGKMTPLPAGSHIARLIARIDEEAHRFAITYHSLLKRKSMLK